MERRDCQRVLAYTVGSAPYAAHQRRLIDEYAASHELEIVGERNDPVRHGPGLLEALRAVDAGEAEGLLVFDLRRIARTTRDLDALATASRFLVAVLGEIDTRRPEGRHLATIYAHLLHDEPARPLRVRGLPATELSPAVWREAPMTVPMPAAAPSPSAAAVPGGPSGLARRLANHLGAGGGAGLPGAAPVAAPAVPRRKPVPSPTTSRT